MPEGGIPGFWCVSAHFLLSKFNVRRVYENAGLGQFMFAWGFLFWVSSRPELIWMKREIV
jgi:hypothetical protein